MSIKQTNSSSTSVDTGAASPKLIRCQLVDDGEGGYTHADVEVLGPSADALALDDGVGFTVNDSPDNPTDLAQLYFARAVGSDVITDFE